MELEFDNEIDALLRKARDDRGILVGDAAKLHFDADEIAAFAENALPDAAKLTYATHFADCDKCRKTLSTVILLNSEAGIEAASSISAPVVAENAAPWYKKLFLFPNLAYVMGALVLLFSGFLAMTFLRNSGGNAANSEVSKVRTDAPAVGANPYFEDSHSSANTMSNAALSANSNASASNTSANTMAKAVNSEGNPADKQNPVFAANSAPKSDDSKQPPSITLDGIASGDSAAAAPPPKATPSDRPVALADKKDLPVAGRRVRELELSKEKDERKSTSEIVQNNGGLYKANKGPSNRNEQQQRNDTQMRDAQPAAKRAAKPEASAISNRRQVAGKTFDLRQSAWYDSTYLGQGTTNVRRGTGEFRKLESGLRYIADSFSGTVVIVWREKAYRID